MKQLYFPKNNICLLITLILFCIANPVKAASPISMADTISYGYDQSGNRISRGIIILKSTKVDHPVDYKANLGKRKVTISPNPNGGQFSLSVTGITTKTDMKVYLYNLSGSLIYENRLPQTSTEIDIDNQPDGMYVLYLIIGKQKKTWKIIKE